MLKKAMRSIQKQDIVREIKVVLKCFRWKFGLTFVYIEITPHKGKDNIYIYNSNLRTIGVNNMRLKELTKIIYEKGTASENRKITVVTMQGEILWRGVARKLTQFAKMNDWFVCEMLVDESDIIDEESGFEKTRYNKGKVIVVY